MIHPGALNAGAAAVLDEHVDAVLDDAASRVSSRVSSGESEHQDLPVNVDNMGVPPPREWYVDARGQLQRHPALPANFNRVGRDGPEEEPELREVLGVDRGVNGTDYSLPASSQDSASTQSGSSGARTIGRVDVSPGSLSKLELKSFLESSAVLR